MLQVRWWGWAAASLGPQGSSQMTTLENEPGSYPTVPNTSTGCSSLPSTVFQRRSPEMLVLLSESLGQCELGRNMIRKHVSAPILKIHPRSGADAARGHMHPQETG